MLALHPRARLHRTDIVWSPSTSVSQQRVIVRSYTAILVRQRCCSTGHHSPDRLPGMTSTGPGFHSPGTRNIDVLSIVHYSSILASFYAMLSVIIEHLNSIFVIIGRTLLFRISGQTGKPLTGTSAASLRSFVCDTDGVMDTERVSITPILPFRQPLSMPLTYVLRVCIPRVHCEEVWGSRRTRRPECDRSDRQWHQRTRRPRT